MDIEKQLKEDKKIINKIGKAGVGNIKLDKYKLYHPIHIPTSTTNGEQTYYYFVDGLEIDEIPTMVGILQKMVMDPPHPSEVVDWLCFAFKRDMRIYYQQLAPLDFSRDPEQKIYGTFLIFREKGDPNFVICSLYKHDNLAPVLKDHFENQNTFVILTPQLKIIPEEDFKF